MIKYIFISFGSALILIVLSSVTSNVTSNEMRNVCLVNARARGSRISTLKLGTTSTFVTSINWASLLPPDTTSKRPTTGSSSDGRNSDGFSNVAAATTSRTRGERADARRAGEEEGGGRGGHSVGGTKERRIPPHAGYTTLSFSRGSPSLPPLFLPTHPFPCPAFSCELARRVRRGANRIRNKTNPISKCAGLARGSNIQRSNWISGLSTSRSVFLFLLPPPARVHRRRRRHPSYLLSCLSCSSLRLSYNLFRERFALPLAR